MDTAAGAARDSVLFSLGRKEPDLVLALIYCVTFVKTHSFSEPLLEKWGLQVSF